jgi:hypothetical protein
LHYIPWWWWWWWWWWWCLSHVAIIIGLKFYWCRYKLISEGYLEVVTDPCSCIASMSMKTLLNGLATFFHYSHFKTLGNLRKVHGQYSQKLGHKSNRRCGKIWTCDLFW